MNDRKRHVLITAQRLFIEKGFASTSVQDILNDALISKGTFYNYFSSKNECLLAILKNAYDEVVVRRKELQIGQDRTDKNILSDQISIRMKVTHEYNVLPIFEMAFHLEDPEIKAYVRNQHFEELHWLNQRLIDVYGKEAALYTSDCAVLLLGMLQHMMHAWRVQSKEKIDFSKLVNFILRRIDSMIADMIRTNDRYLGQTHFIQSCLDTSQPMMTKEQLLTQLNSLLSALDTDMKENNAQYIEFIIDEIQSNNPRLIVLESIIHSFRKAFVGTSFELRAHEVSSNLWRYIDTLVDQNEL